MTALAGRPWRMLVNPAAGQRGRGLRGALEALRASGIRPELVEPKDPAETKAAAHAWAGREAVVAVYGGDGTLNAAALGLAGGKALLAAFPGGTENVLCRELGLSLNPAKAAFQLARGRGKAWDLGLLGDRGFLVAAGVGFDAEVCFRATGAYKRVLGRGAFALSALSGFLREARTFDVEVNGQTHAGCWQAVFSNGSRYGGGIPFNPGAKGDDGFLDGAFLSYRSRLGRFVQGLRVLASGGKRGLERRSLRHAKIHGPGLLAAQVDGEPFKAENPGVSVRPGAIHIVVPQETQEVE